MSARRMFHSGFPSPTVPPSPAKNATTGSTPLSADVTTAPPPSSRTTWKSAIPSASASVLTSATAAVPNIVPSGAPPRLAHAAAAFPASPEAISRASAFPASNARDAIKKEAMQRFRIVFMGCLSVWELNNLSVSANVPKIPPRVHPKLRSGKHDKEKHHLSERGHPARGAPRPAGWKPALRQRDSAYSAFTSTTRKNPAASPAGAGTVTGVSPSASAVQRRRTVHSEPRAGVHWIS